MNSKRNQIALLGVVIVVWGLVVYRFTSLPLRDSENISPIAISASQPSNISEIEYEYKLNYRDPFLQKAFVKRPSTRPKKVEVRRDIPKKVLPKVSLQGIILSNNEKVGILKINSETHMVKEGEEIFEIKILQISDKKLRIKYQPLDSVMVLATEKN